MNIHMNPVTKILIGSGVLLIVIGLFWQLGGRYFPFGRLPGDIAVERENFSFYFPLATCLLLSAVLSLVFYIFRLFGNR